MDSQDNVSQVTEAVYKTKIVQFLGRSVPIILQNDNGPCPLLAICNVLLLENILKLSVDTVEIGSSKLLSLVAERLLDSNSNMENKDEEYTRNQRQNISDAITLLPRLATGLDVNVRFRNIHDFEFTRECTVFDLLDIGLVHGWLCDPQDEVTSKVIGNKSYNSLVEKLVDGGDFTTETKAALGVPSPSHAVLLNTQSFSELQKLNVAEIERQRKGDAEEKFQLLQALRISMNSNEYPSGQIADDFVYGNVIQKNENTELLAQGKNSVIKDDKENPHLVTCKDENSFLQTSMGADQLDCSDGSGAVSIQQIGSSSHAREDTTSLERDAVLPVYDKESKVLPVQGLQEVLEVQRTSDHEDSSAEGFKRREEDAELPAYDEELKVLPVQGLQEVLEVQRTSDHEDFSAEGFKRREEDSNCAVLDHRPVLSTSECMLDMESSQSPSERETEVGTSQIEDGLATYEEEVNLAGGLREIGLDEEGVIISNFLQTHASQLTYYGLFCLQEGLKERELCVFFRNNHFNTMFKYEGQLYLLVTDQGYINQPDIVWEKLDEVYGDTVFMTGTFLPFQAGEEGNSGWDERSAIAHTEEFLSAQQNHNAQKVESSIDSLDLQLAMYLQQQEFEQQNQSRSTPSASTLARPQPQTEPGRADGSRLITGPRKSSYSSSKQDAKSKCEIM